MGAAVWLRRGNKKHPQPSRLHSRVGHSWGPHGILDPPYSSREMKLTVTAPFVDYSEEKMVLGIILRYRSYISSWP